VEPRTASARLSAALKMADAVFITLTISLVCGVTKRAQAGGWLFLLAWVLALVGLFVR
jgi:hypothetical protein